MLRDGYYTGCDRSIYGGLRAGREVVWLWLGSVWVGSAAFEVNEVARGEATIDQCYLTHFAVQFPAKRKREIRQRVQRDERAERGTTNNTRATPQATINKMNPTHPARPSASVPSTNDVCSNNQPLHNQRDDSPADADVADVASSAPARGSQVEPSTMHLTNIIPKKARSSYSSNDTRAAHNTVICTTLYDHDSSEDDELTPLSTVMQDKVFKPMARASINLNTNSTNTHHNYQRTNSNNTESSVNKQAQMLEFYSKHQQQQISRASHSSTSEGSNGISKKILPKRRLRVFEDDDSDDASTMNSGYGEKKTLFALQSISSSMNNISTSNVNSTSSHQYLTQKLMNTTSNCIKIPKKKYKTSLRGGNSSGEEGGVICNSKNSAKGTSKKKIATSCAVVDTVELGRDQKNAFRSVSGDDVMDVLIPRKSCYSKMISAPSVNERNDVDSSQSDEDVWEESMWTCHKCSRFNHSSKMRCGSCKAWKGDKSVRYDHQVTKTSASSSDDDTPAIDEDELPPRRTPRLDALALNRTELKPLFAVGDEVYAAWGENNEWYPGRIKSYKVVESGGEYGQMRLYSVDFDDGDALDDVGDEYVHPKQDYLISFARGRREDTWLGVHNVTDEKSEDNWAKYVGWYNVVIGESDFSLDVSMRDSFIVLHTLLTLFLHFRIVLLHYAVNRWRGDCVFILG
jgi:hypothetical protein